MMTRETKAGIVVSCSFLVLVGVVVVSKWKGGEPAALHEDAELAALAESFAEPTPSEPSEPSEALTSTSTPATSAPTTSTPTRSDAIHSIPSPASRPMTPVADASSIRLTRLHENDPTRVTEPTIRTEPTMRGPETAGTVETPATTSVPPAPVTDSTPPASTPATVTTPDSVATAPATTETTPPAPATATAPPSPATATSETVPSAPSPSDTATAPAAPAPETATSPPAPATATPPPATASAAPVDENAPPPPPSATRTSAGNSIRTAEPPVATRSEPQPSLAGTPAPGASANTGAAATGRSDLEPPPELPGMEKKKFELPPPPPAVNPKNGAVFTKDYNDPPTGSPVNRIQPTPSAATPPPSSHTIGATPAVTATPRIDPMPGANLLRPVPAGNTGSTGGVLPAPARAAIPAGDDAPPSDQYAQLNPAQNRYNAPPAQVDSYDELVYRCKPGDTMQGISTAYYQTDKLAQALLLFNRSHPQVGDGIRQEPPVLQPGDKVFIPPQRILEKKYALAIPNFTPLPVVKQTPPPQVGLAPPRPAGIAPPAGVAPPAAVVSVPPAAAPPAAIPGAAPNAGTSWATPTGDKQYRVHRNGELLRDIAGRTLSNRDRWIEIYRLNMRFNPEYPIPEGTVLRLPADARVDLADRP